MHDSITLPLVRKASTAGQPGADPAIILREVAGFTGHSHLPADNSMTWTPSATRADVVRMVARYVRLAFSIRSAAGRLAIDESRISRRRTEQDPIDIMEMSWVEIVEAQRYGKLRAAVMAAPERRHDVRSTVTGDPLRCVAPTRDVAPIVRGRAHGSGNPATGTDARNWRATVAQKLARIPRPQAEALLEVANLRMRQEEVTNQLDAVSRAERRMKSGGRNARNIRRHAAARVDELRSQKTAFSDRLARVVRTNLYRQGVDNLLTVCTKTAEIEQYLLLEEWK